MKLLILLVCLPLSAQWAHVPWHKLIERSKLVVTGDVVDFGKDPQGRRTAIFRISNILKGECKDKEISLPFKTDISWDCDYTFTYEKRKYLLLIDDEHYFRLVHYPNRVMIPIDDIACPEVNFTRTVIGLQAGGETEKRVQELKKYLDPALWPGEVFELARALPRRVLRPLFPSLRDAYGANWRRARLAPEDPRVHQYVLHSLIPAAEVMRDFSLVGELLEYEPCASKAMLAAFSRLGGREFPSRAAFVEWWNRNLQRSKAQGRLEEINSLIPLLQSKEPEARRSAREAILDLGPRAIDPVRKHALPAEAGARACFQEVLEELELLREIHDDLKATHR